MGVSREQSGGLSFPLLLSAACNVCALAEVPRAFLEDEATFNRNSVWYGKKMEGTWVPDIGAATSAFDCLLLGVYMGDILSLCFFLSHLCH